MKTLSVIRSLLIATVAAALCGCAELKALAKTDIDGDNSLPGAAQDVVLTPATSRKMNVFRSAELFAILSQAGVDNVREPAEEAYFVKKVVAINGDINQAYKMLGKPCKGSPNNMTEGCAELLQGYNTTVLEPDLVDLAKFALPNDKLQKFLSAAVKSDIIGSFEALATAGGAILLEFHRGAGIRRAGIEVEMQWATTPPGTYEDAITAFYDAASYDEVLKGSHKASKKIGALEPDDKAVSAMYFLALGACNKIVGRMPDASKNDIASVLSMDKKSCLMTQPS